MTDRKKYELADFNDKTSEYEEVTCECGNFLFKTFLPIYDERGITEESFFCDCGAIYHWAYGSVVEKVCNGVDWLLKRAEDARSAEQNLSAVKRELRKLKDENKRYREALENTQAAIQKNLSKAQYKDEDILFEAWTENKKALEG